jgi:hypothetical protein
MKIKFNKSKDFFAGLIFIFFGIAAICLAQEYPMGSARRMGPAYFPSIVGGALAIFGFVILARSLWSLSEPVRLPTLRPLIMITGTVVGFALLLKPLGLVLALFVLILISCLGGSQFRLREVAILYILLVLIAVTFFVYGLGLQFSLWPT